MCFADIPARTDIVMHALLCSCLTCNACIAMLLSDFQVSFYSVSYEKFCNLFSQVSYHCHELACCVVGKFCSDRQMAGDY